MSVSVVAGPRNQFVRYSATKPHKITIGYEIIPLNQTVGGILFVMSSPSHEQNQALVTC